MAKPVFLGAMGCRGFRMLSTCQRTSPDFRPHRPIKALELVAPLSLRLCGWRPAVALHVAVLRRHHSNTLRKA